MLAEKLRELAAQLRKEAAAMKLPGALPNPMASRATGDLGSLAPKALPKPKAPESTSTVGG